jgi:hypothetical protein
MTEIPTMDTGSLRLGAFASPDSDSEDAEHGAGVVAWGHPVSGRLSLLPAAGFLALSLQSMIHRSESAPGSRPGASAKLRARSPQQGGDWAKRVVLAVAHHPTASARYGRL